MDGFFEVITSLFELAQGGFDTVNQVVGLVIALIATVMMTSWRGLWGSALGSAFAFILVGLVRPVLDGGKFALPDLLSIGFWATVLALFMGFALVITVFYFVKTLLGRGGHKGAH